MQGVWAGLHSPLTGEEAPESTRHGRNSMHLKSIIYLMTLIQHLPIHTGKKRIRIRMTDSVVGEALGK